MSGSQLLVLTVSLLALFMLMRWAQGNELRHRGSRPMTFGHGILKAISLAVVLVTFVSVAMRSSAQDMSTGSLNVTVTDSSGGLIPGASLVLRDLETNDINQVTNLTAALKVGSTKETVTVIADHSPILDTTTNTLSTNIDMKEVQDLPT